METTAAAATESAKLQRHFGRFDILFFLICTIVGVDTIASVASSGGEAFTWMIVLAVVFFVVPALEIGRAPSPGKRRSLTGSKLRQIISRAAPEVAVDAPERVWIASDKRTVEPAWVRARLEDAIRRRMPWPAEAVELRDWRLPAAFDAPPGATRLIVRFRPDEDFSGPLSARRRASAVSESSRARSLSRATASSAWRAAPNTLRSSSSERMSSSRRRSASSAERAVERILAGVRRATKPNDSPGSAEAVAGLHLSR